MGPTPHTSPDVNCSEQDLTQLLQNADTADPDVRARLIQASYHELRRIAAARMSDERQNHTLTSTALVHEVSMKLLTESQLPVSSRGQFFAWVATAMRRYLIDHARSRGTQKRGGDRRQFTFDEAIVACRHQRDDFLALNDALETLAEIDPRKARLVEMRYFGGLSNHEISEALSISPATVKRDWTVAKTWLLSELRGDDDTDFVAEHSDGP